MANISHPDINSDLNFCLVSPFLLLHFQKIKNKGIKDSMENIVELSLDFSIDKLKYNKPTLLKTDNYLKNRKKEFGKKERK